MQLVTSTFHQLAQGGVRPHKWEILMSFDKQFDDTLDYFVLNSSELDGSDVLKPIDDNPIQYWDYYSYAPFRDRLQSMSWSSSLAFPHSIQSATADISLNNYDNYFTPNTSSPLAPYILPGRPVKILAGYGSEATIQQFVGTTQGNPTLDSDTKSAAFHALGFIAEISALSLSYTVALSDVRTDEALVAIFEQFGISGSAYSLDRGRNTIPFLFLESGVTVGDALSKIMEAEGGELYVDEMGIIRFVQRLSNPAGPVFTFNISNVVSDKPSDNTQIINHVIIKSTIRALQDLQPIFFGSGTSGNATLTNKLLVPASGTAQYNVSLNDPLADFDDPTLGIAISDSWFTAQTSGGDNVASSVSLSDSSLTVTDLTLTFQNTNSFDVYIDAIEVWGQPAKIVDNIVYDARDQDSIDKYGEYIYEADNDLFGNESNCESFAYTVLDAYAQPGTIIDMIVKGDYSLQLGDIVWIDLSDISGPFKIIGISTSISTTGIEETIQVKRYDPRHWFVLDSSELDGGDVLAP